MAKKKKWGRIGAPHSATRWAWLKKIARQARQNPAERRGGTMTRQEETKVVRSALLKAGIPVRHVRHGTGTSWGWLHITLDLPWDEHELRQKAEAIVEKATGRHGEYSRIGIS